MKLKSFFCSHPECTGKPAVTSGNASRKLCIRHNVQRLAANKEKNPGVKLAKRIYIPHHTPPAVDRRKQIRGKRQPIKVKDWKLDAKKVLDNIFSKYIRKKYGPMCYTCKAEHAYSNGHFKGRSNLATRYEEDDCRPQGKICNDYLHGNLKIFRELLVREIGIERVERIEALAKTEKHLTEHELKELATMYESKLNLL